MCPQQAIKLGMFPWSLLQDGKFSGARWTWGRAQARDGSAMLSVANIFLSCGAG